MHLLWELRIRLTSVVTGKQIREGKTVRANLPDDEVVSHSAPESEQTVVKHKQFDVKSGYPRQILSGKISRK